MGLRGTEMDGQPTADGTPEDVAVLYSWANLQGAKYRDYSASRREYRAQIRYRAAKALLERELRALGEAEASAAEAERIALAAEARAQDNESAGAGSHSLRHAEEAAREAAAGRVEAARRAEAAAHAGVMALREQRELSDAHSSAQRQAQLYEESEQRRRQLAGPQPRIPPDVTLIAPYESSNISSAATQQPPHSQVQRSPDRTPAYEEFPFNPAFGSDILGPTMPASESAGSQFRIDNGEADRSERGPTGPAWLYASQTPPQAHVLQPISLTPPVELVAGDTLQDSRERVASRWFALKDVSEQRGLELPAIQSSPSADARTRLLAVFSLAGGVGKTSLVATLGRALASQGECVVLTDTTSRGLLPIYFGVREVRPGVVATFSPPPESTAQQISMVTFDLTDKSGFEPKQDALVEEMLRHRQDNHRLLLDLSSASSWLIRRIADLHPTVLVPMAPDMNSVFSLRTVEKLFLSITDSLGHPVLPFYILNQFDGALALHLDVREVLRRQLGDRLLRTAIRRSPAVSEALAQGMTVLDYAPDAPVSQDYLEVAAWLRSAFPAASEVRALRGER